MFFYKIIHLLFSLSLCASVNFLRFSVSIKSFLAACATLKSCFLTSCSRTALFLNKVLIYKSGILVLEYLDTKVDDSTFRREIGFIHIK